LVAVSYASYIQDLIDKLKAVINGTTSFASKVSADIVEEVTYNPAARIELSNDAFTPNGPASTEHITTFTVKVRYLAGVSESDMDTLIGYVGEIVDAVEDDRTLGSSYVTNSEVTGAEYSIQTVNESGSTMVVRHCHLGVEVQGIRQPT